MLQGQTAQLALLQTAAKKRSNAGVPDRPAVALLDSLVAAVDGENDRGFAFDIHEAVAGMTRLEAEAAMMLQSECMAVCHGAFL